MSKKDLSIQSTEKQILHFPDKQKYKKARSSCRGRYFGDPDEGNAVMEEVEVEEEEG